MKQNGFPYPWEYAHRWLNTWTWSETIMGEVLERRSETILNLGAPYDNEADVTQSTEQHFEVTYSLDVIDWFQVKDHFCQITTPLPWMWLENPKFDLAVWYTQHLARLDAKTWTTVATKPKHWLALTPLINNLLCKFKHAPDQTRDLSGICTSGLT